MDEKKEAEEAGGIPRWTKILLLGVMVFLISISYLRSTWHKHAENAPNIQDGSADAISEDRRRDVPDILLTAKVGNSKRLSEYRGKVVLLSFWASWCTPCIVELPTFIDIYEKLGSKGLVILPVNVDDAEAAANFVGNFWTTRKFPFPTFYDPEKKASEQFRIDALPSNFVLDKKGRLVAQGFGANDWSSESSIKLMEQLLAER